MKRHLLFLIASVLIIGLTSCSEEEIKNSIIPEESPPGSRKQQLIIQLVQKLKLMKLIILW